MKSKTYLSAQGLLEDSFKLAQKVFDSGFKPTFIIAVWRGGAPIGIAVQEYLAFHGIETDNIAIRTSSYQGIDNQAKEVKVQGLNYLVKNIQHHDRLLIVDDVFDSGRSVETIIARLTELCRLNTPEDIRVAVPYYKPERNQTNLIPDYYLYETQEWLKYPHSLEGLSPQEIAEHRPELFEIIKHHLPE
ncbi:phosphoribosyltransferase [Alteromonas lipolytica]|uniref:Hypoxanthine phosphoribosyltransferase n=1 Tax=Alteromonas lipolytica TaxID=1856405 RepID=A0A1E8FGV3_9ALTE|nr:phosphoribosyltransferase family protein [Alteromonas lipolytica]OFI35187.1 hypoxanthine phosphoribosyltransferase [Alteromonas lipolytica]GGF57458.1 hypoxanthine phosphoribosyltransferase [Alteromonas lipolytica]